MLARNRALEARLLEDPDDPLGYEVYGDWLCSQGSPHGELMQLQRARQREPQDRVWRAREAELLDRHAAALVGPTLAPRARFLAWDTGYVRAISASTAQLSELLDYPAGLLVRDVVVSATGSLQGAIDRVAAAPPIVTSLRLLLAANDRVPGVADPGVLWRSQPGMVRLELRGGSFMLDGASAGVLRELIVAPRHLNHEHLGALAAGSLPALEQLELWFDDDDGRARARWNRVEMTARDLDQMASLLASLPASMRELRIWNADAGDALCDMICRLPLADRLRRLVLSDCGVTDAGAAVLRAHRDRFTNIEVLEVSSRGLTNQGALQAFPGLVFRNW